MCFYKFYYKIIFNYLKRVIFILIIFIILIIFFNIKINCNNKVHKYLRKNYKITFSCIPIGSGKRNMVIKQCNKNYFDLDFQIVLQSMPDEYNSNDSCKALKDLFRSVFDKFKLPGFSECKDSTQALTIKMLKVDMDLIL